MSATSENTSARCPSCFQGPSADPDERNLKTALGLGPVNRISAVGANNANDRIAFVREDINGLLDTSYSRNALSVAGDEVCRNPEDTYKIPVYQGVL
jgi:hypothetical protein